MTVVHTLKLYEIINRYFRNKDDSKAFVSEMDSFVSIKLVSDNHNLATKSDIKKLETEITELKSEFNSQVSKLEIKMGEGFKNILKWIIVLLIGFASLIIACMKAFS